MNKVMKKKMLIIIFLLNSCSTEVITKIDDSAKNSSLDSTKDVVSSSSPTPKLSSVPITDVKINSPKPTVTHKPTSTPSPTITMSPTIKESQIPTQNINKLTGKIVFTSFKDFTNQIYIMNADGTNQTPLTDKSLGQNYSPSWSPDGSKIAFISERKSENGHIFIMNSDGSNQKKISKSISWEYSPSWSPDGTKIAFISTQADKYKSLNIMDIDGSNILKISNNLSNDSSPSWSPDGSKIAFTSTKPEINNPNIQQRDIYIVDISTLKQNKISDYYSRDTSISWSPDGNKLIFTSTDLDKKEMLLLSINKDGTDKKQIFNGYPYIWAEFAIYSPDGKNIVFSNGLVNERGNLLVINSESTNLTLANDLTSIITDKTLSNESSSGRYKDLKWFKPTLSS